MCVMNRPLGRVALVGFFLSLLVHLLTFAGVDVYSRIPYVWSLQLGMLLVWIPFVTLNGRGFRTQRMELLREIISGLPTRAGVLVAGVFAYTILNFFLCANLSGSGNADIVGGQCVLSSHGRILAHLTESEYHLHRANEVRMFSGLWLTFYLVPGIYLTVDSPAQPVNVDLTPGDLPNEE
jgi:hypothetical protein